MPARVYHIDPVTGNDSNDGLSPQRPLKDYRTCEPAPGDRVLFKCGSVIRHMLRARNGEKGKPVIYASYGQGRKPVFMGSVPADDPKLWVKEKPSLWRYTGSFPSEVCNLIFNHGESCGNLRWSVGDLRQQGEWHCTNIGNTCAGESGGRINREPGKLYLFSSANPGAAYSSIECALWGERRLAGGNKHIIFDGLSFMNAGVHGYQATAVEDVQIRNCDFRFIGGAVWNFGRRIRFGNAIEIWEKADNVTVEGCVFDNIYDSGVTHQGGHAADIPQRIFFRDNLFYGCGMAAYECREPSREIYFERNTCIASGGGFSMQGETPPRQSEIHPQPTGHHVFIWRVEPGTQAGAVHIRDNIFHKAPYGAAVYSIIDPVDAGKFTLDRNCYWQIPGGMLVHMNGKSYMPGDFAAYQKECGQDQNSIVADPGFADEAGGDYSLSTSSPCSGMGCTSKFRLR
ncbi:MAG: hypothetical protein PHR35_04865 [Kiritimatiellae bacterium]|nr:hypothetical protein [Kiritimatiellia bacterium]